MSAGERVAPIAAALSAASTVLCCLPLSFVGAVGIAGVSAAMLEYRSWLIGVSLILLVIGFLQVHRSRGRCARRSRVSIVMLWMSAVVAAFVFLFPQVVATLLADWLE